MRIAVWHNLPSGGGKRALFDHVLGLLDRGHHVEIWRPSGVDDSYLPLSRLATEHQVPLAIPTKTPTAALMRLSPSHWNARIRLAAMDQHTQECARQIRSGKFDVLFANSCQFFRVTSIGRFTEIPTLLYLQEPYRWLYEALPRLPWIPAPPLSEWIKDRGQIRRVLSTRLRLGGNRFQAREELRNAQAFDRILVNSYFSRESLLRAYGLNSRVCYLGIREGLFRDLRLPRENFVVSLGAITPEKRPMFIIDALSHIPPSLRPQLRWIGNVADPTYKQEVIRFAERKGVDLQLLISISDERLVELLNTAKLMMYAPHLEPFGYAPLEANACGLPVVAIAEGGVRETVEHDVNGLLAEALPECMAAAATSLLKDEGYRMQMGRKAAEHVRSKWSHIAAVDRIERELAEVAGAAIPSSKCKTDSSVTTR